MADEKITIERVVCVGKRPLAKGGYALAYKAVADWHVHRTLDKATPTVTGTVTNKTQIYDLKKSSPFIGAVFDISQTEKTYYLAGEHGPKFVGTWGNAAEVAEWTATAHGFTIEEVNEKQIKKGKQSIDGLDAILAPLYKAMQATNYTGRCAIVADIVRRLWSNGARITTYG